VLQISEKVVYIYRAENKRRRCAMKKLLTIVFIALLIALLVGCRADVASIEDPQAADPPLIAEDVAAAENDQAQGPDVAEEPAEIQSSLPLDLAAMYFSMMEAILDKDDGALWGVNLNGPFMFVDSLTRNAAANRPDRRGVFTRQGDIYVGTLHSQQFIGVTATRFSFEMWGMMTWDFLEQCEDDKEVVRIMIHELFHAWQDELFGEFPQVSRDAFVEDLETNIFIRLELNALLRALVGNTEEERLRATLDALSIREERRQRGLGMTAHDIAVTISEGTAQYTDLMLGFSDIAARLAIIEDFIDDHTRSGIRSLSTYLFGAMYGFLLDEVGASWRVGLCYGTDLGLLLQDALGVTEFKPFGEIDLELYGLSEATAIATAWHEDLDRMARSTRAAFSAQPTLSAGLLRELMGGLSGDYDHITVHGLGEEFGSVLYGNIVLAGAFGQLTVHGGPMLLNGYRIPVPGIVIEESRAFGHNWELELNEGFGISEVAGGNFRVVHLPDA